MGTLDSLFMGIPGTDGIDHSDPIAVLKAISAPPQAAPPTGPGLPQSPLAPPPPTAAPPASDRWRALMNLVGPVAGFFGSPNPAGQAAFMNAWSDLEQKHAADTKQKQEAGAKYLLEVGQHAMGLTDPAQFNSFIKLAEEAGTRAGWIKPGDLQRQIAFPTSQFAQVKIKEISDELDALEKEGYNLDDLAKTNGTITLKDRTKVPISTALDLARKRPLVDGQPVVRPPKDKRGFTKVDALVTGPDGTATRQEVNYDADTGQYTDPDTKAIIPSKSVTRYTAPPTLGETERAGQLLGKIREAKAKGDVAGAATLQGQYDDILAAKKALGDTGDMAGLHKTLLELQAESLRQRNAQGGANGGLTDDAIDYAATQYRVTGMMPAIGRSGPGRASVVNRAAAQAKALGQSPAVAFQKQMAFKADAASLTKIASMSAAAEAFETKALAQADIVDSLSQKVDRTNYPIINDGLLTAKARIAGDANTQLLFNALATFTTEYAKIMEGSTGSGAAASDSARSSAAKLISAGLSKGTLSQTLDLMRKEMALTIQGYDAVKEHITGRMGGAPSTTTTPDVGPQPGSFKVGGFTVTVSK